MTKTRSTTKGYFGALAECVEKDSECDAERTSTAPVTIKEIPNGYTVWEGDVEIFTLFGHPTAKRCYAWAVQTGDDWEVTTILELSPVTSPESAVKAAIADRIRKQ